MWKGTECAAGKNFSNLVCQTAHGCQMRQPPPKKYKLPNENKIGAVLQKIYSSKFCNIPGKTPVLEHLQTAASENVHETEKS